MRTPPTLHLVCLINLAQKGKTLIQPVEALKRLLSLGTMKQSNGVFLFIVL